MHTHPEKIFFFHLGDDGLNRYFADTDNPHRVTSHMHLWTDTAYHVVDTPDYDCRADGIEIMQKRLIDPRTNDIATLDKVYKFDRKNPWQTPSANMTTVTNIQSTLSYNDKLYGDLCPQYMTPMTVTRHDVAFNDTRIQATHWHVPSLAQDIALLTLNPVMTASHAMRQTPDAVDARLRRLGYLYEMIDDMLCGDVLAPMDDMPMQQVAKGMCVFKMP